MKIILIEPLKQEIENEDNHIQELPNSWASHGNYRLVGNGEVTNRYCGKFARLKGCLRVDLHNKTTLDGVNYAGKVFVRRVHYSCGKPSCPICYKSGWAVREAENIKHRLVEASKRFGKVEHLVCSIPAKDYGLELGVLRCKVYTMLKEIGVVGGALIFHGFRYNRKKGWYWSPHFHVMGFIFGGYSRCRHCKGGDCYACDGFDGKTYKLYHENGYIVKVFGERVTIFGTAWYQLNHSSYKEGVKRFHIATWFGNCSYRKLKVTAKIRKECCPICNNELYEIQYFGSKSLDLSDERDSFENFEEDGQIVFVEKIKSHSGS